MQPDHTAPTPSGSTPDPTPRDESVASLCGPEARTVVCSVCDYWDRMPHRESALMVVGDPCGWLGCKGTIVPASEVTG